LREHDHREDPRERLCSHARTLCRAEEVEEDEEPFEEKMRRLTARLGEQFQELSQLEAEIRTNLKGLGYEI